MTMQPVESSNIHSVGYDAPSKKLRVRFRSGNTYEYPNISAEQHAALTHDPSPGSYFHRTIRNNPAHAHRKLVA